MKWDEMSPRERDNLVAEEVMGLTLFASNANMRTYSASTGEYGDVLHYTTDISASWEVVEKMDTYTFEISTSEDEWIAKFLPWPIVYTDAIAKTAPEAICLAALRAMGWMYEPPHTPSTTKREHGISQLHDTTT